MISAPADAARNLCEATVAERLERLNVDPSDIRRIDYVPVHRSRRDNTRVIGFEAWVSLRSCRGNLVINLSKRCRIRDVYGRGECELGG